MKNKLLTPKVIDATIKFETWIAIDDIVREIELINNEPKQIKKQVHFHTKAKYKIIPNRFSLYENKEELWWNSKTYIINRYILSNEISIFMMKYNYTNFKECATLFWEDNLKLSMIL